MKRILPLCLPALLLMSSGCAWMERHTPWHHNNGDTDSSKSASNSQNNPAIVTPDDSLAAKVVSVDTVGQFVVLSFPEGRMPKMDQHLYLYRGGLKAAEVKIVGPKQDTSIVADILTGDAQVGDTVRDQ